jgi:hypothetical protein
VGLSAARLIALALRRSEAVSLDTRGVQAHILKSTLLCTLCFFIFYWFFLLTPCAYRHTCSKVLCMHLMFFIFSLLYLDAMRVQAQVLKSTLCREDFRHTLSKVPSIEALCSKMNRTLILESVRHQVCLWSTSCSS